MLIFKRLKAYRDKRRAIKLRKGILEAMTKERKAKFEELRLRLERLDAERRINRG